MQLKTLKDVIKFVNEYWINLEMKDVKYSWGVCEMDEDGNYRIISSGDNFTSSGDF